MAYRRGFACVLVLTLAVLLLTGSAASSQASRDVAPPNSARTGQTRTTAEQAGVYQLFKITKRGEDELFRINTRTGQVWLYSEYVVLSSESLGVKGAEKEGLDKLIEEARRQGKNVYTLPFWDLTAETRPQDYTIH